MKSNPHNSFNHVLKPSFSEEVVENVVHVPTPVAQEENEQPEEKEETTKKSNDIEKLIVHVSNKTNKKVFFIDKPYLMKSRQTSKTKGLKEGWYKIDTHLEDMSDLEKKKTGISLNQKAFNIDIISIEKCQSEQCN